MASVILKKAGKIQRIVYIITYIALIVYPLYKIISPAGLLPWILSLIVYIGLILVILGIIYSNPEIIVLYYIISGIIYQVSPVPGAPSSFEIMIYALLVLHIDIISKIIGTGIGYRKIRTGIQGLMASIIIPAGIIGIYVYVAYILSGFFLSLSTAMYTSNPLSSLIIGLFLRTRFGNIIFFLLISLVVFYILSNYLTNTISDMVLLNPQYVRDRITRWLREEYELLIKNSSWHQKLFMRALYIIIFLFIWSFTAPAIIYINDVLTFVSKDLLSIPVFLVSLAISIIFYIAIRRSVSRFLSLKVSIEKPSPPKLKRPSNITLYLSMALLIVYTVLFMFLENADINYLLGTALGFYTPSPTASYNRPFNILYNYLDSGYIWIQINLPIILDRYMSSVSNNLLWLTYIIRLLIELLWG